MLKLNDRKTINAWCMYDWANSVYSLVISSTIFPVYYNGVTNAAFGQDNISFFGYSISNTVLYSYSLSFAFLIITMCSPLLSGIADYGGRRKRFMKFFTYLGGLSCIGLYWFNGTNVEYGIILSVLACIGFAGGLVFYNAYLPVIATPEKYDIISAKGYSLGYIGSVILLVFNLITISSFESLGFTDELQAVRLSFILVGIWWMGFAQITFSVLPSNKRSGIDYKNIVKKGYLELVVVWKRARRDKMLKRFLTSFFFYSMGVQTVMYLAALFGDKELHMPGDRLIITILIIQIVAVGGSYLFARLSEKKGNIFSLSIMVFIWIFICLYAYFLSSEYEFYFLAAVVGLVMGGIQSLSRATYSKLIPKNTIDQTSYFSFYDVLEKIAIVLGTFSYALIEQMTGSMRNSALTLGLFFLAGIAFLRLVKIPEEPFRTHAKKSSE